MQEEHSKINEMAWNQMAYDAWVYRFGTPNEAAEKIKKDPLSRLGPLKEFLNEVNGKKIVNLLGSHGNKAVALALLGADVTVVDFSYENSRYALDLARAAGTRINYIVSDVLKLPAEELTGDYDVAFAELGILHYFLDLKPFMEVFKNFLKPGGKMIIQDFHPISTKLITSKGKKHKVTGDYFNSNIEETDVAYMKYISGLENMSEDEKKALQKARLRKWTLGEVVTAVAEVGFHIELLKEDENPKPEDKGIPKLFTLISSKI